MATQRIVEIAAVRSEFIYKAWGSVLLFGKHKMGRLLRKLLGKVGRRMYGALY